MNTYDSMNSNAFLRQKIILILAMVAAHLSAVERVTTNLRAISWSSGPGIVAERKCRSDIRAIFLVVMETITQDLYSNLYAAVVLPFQFKAILFCQSIQVRACDNLMRCGSIINALDSISQNPQFIAYRFLMTKL